MISNFILGSVVSTSVRGYVTGFVCRGVNIVSNQTQEHFLIHKSVVELQEEDIKWIIEGRTEQDQFIVGFARPEGKLEKKRSDFFKLQSVSILIIRGQRHLSAVSVN